MSEGAALLNTRVQGLSSVRRMTLRWPVQWAKTTENQWDLHLASW